MSGFTVNGLVDFVKENNDNILTNAILGAETLSKVGISIQAGIKNSEKLVLFENTAPIQAGGDCAFNASGSSTFTNVTLTVTELKWNDTFCPEDLQKKYLGQAMPAGSNYDSLPFEELIIGQVTKNIARNLDVTIWQGDTTNVGTSIQALKRFDGLLKKIDAGSSVSATQQSSITAGNIIAIMDDIYVKIPEELNNNPERPMVAMMGWANFKLLVIAAKTLNYFNFDPAQAYATGEMVMPGTGLKVMALNALNNVTGTAAAMKNRIICTYPKNLYYGTDLQNEYEDARLWYSQDDQNIKGTIKWKSGVQIAYTNYVVEYTNS